jgi:hypothetical protein
MSGLLDGGQDQQGEQDGPTLVNRIEDIEPFVDADEAGKFLALKRRRILELARVGKLPGHPIGDDARRVWRFRLSELAAAVLAPGKSGLASRERASMVRGQVHPRIIGTEA